MVGAFRLFKQVAGRAHFANVEVELVPVTSAARYEVIFDVSSQSPPPEQWRAAAERGCSDALAALRNLVLPVAEGISVRVTRLDYTWVDTNADAVYAASYLAVVAAAGVQSRFELFRDPEWRVRLRDSI